MGTTLKELQRELSIRCDDVVEGIATAGTSTSLTDSRLADTFSDDDVFNGGTLVINGGAGLMLFTTDCETVPVGDFSTAVVTDNNCKLYRDKTYKANGKWSYKCVTGSDASDQAYCTKTLDTTYSTVYAQARFYATASYTGASTIISVQTAGGVQIVGLKLTANALSLYNTTAAEAYTPISTTFSVDTWHRLEVGLVCSATVGQVHLWLDETHIYTGRGLNTGATPAQIIGVGLLSTTVAEAKTIWFDDVKIDQSYIGTRVAETEKTISDYTGSTGKLDWSGSIVSPTANVTRYAVYDWPKTWRSPEQKKRAINNAIRTMFPYWYKEVVDPPTDYGSAASLTAVQNQYYYELPSDCESIIAVWIESSSSVVPYWQEVNWAMDSSGGVKYLRLPGASGYTTGLDIRIHYIAIPVALDNANDELNVADAYLGNAVEYIMHHALAYLWSNTSSATAAEQARANNEMQQALLIKQRYPMPMRVKTEQMRTSSHPISFEDRIVHP